MSLVTIQDSPGIAYPKFGDFSPENEFPEYPWGSEALGSSRIYDLVRECLDSYLRESDGADVDNAGLKRWIRNRDRVLVLPNMVMHRRCDESERAFFAKCTHGSVLRAVVDHAVMANLCADRVMIGNAPIQACDFHEASRETGSLAVRDFYGQRGYPEMGPQDFRNFSTKRTRFGALLSARSEKPEHMVTLDLGVDSLLEDLFKGGQPRLRIGDYPEDAISYYHRPGKHLYILDRRVLESDVIITVAKLKTHQKVGITCALKGTVGAVARKECLAHHRRGCPKSGGDEYPTSSLFRHLGSRLADRTGEVDASFGANALRILAKAYLRMLRLGPRGIMGGSWYGNDTAWRMALDVARLLRYGRTDGTLCDTPVRQHIGIIDGIIGGEGEGPLRPRPRPLGAVLFSPDIRSLDAACALVMGYDPRKIPLVKNSFEPMRYPLGEGTLDDMEIVLNGAPTSSQEVGRRFYPPFMAPKGWRGAIEA